MLVIRVMHKLSDLNAYIKLGGGFRVVEVRGWRTEDRRQKTEDRGQRSEGRGQKTEDRRQRAKVRGQKSAPSTQHPDKIN